MDKKIYLTILAAVATVAVVWLFALLAAPFAKPLAWALIIGIATMPHHERLNGLFPEKPNRAAALLILIITLCIILPVAGIIVLIAENATTWYAESEQLVLSFTSSIPDTLGQFQLGNKIIKIGEKLGLDIAGYAAKFAATASQFLLEVATNTAKNMAELFFTLVVALFILFFIYRDGSSIISKAVVRLTSSGEKAEKAYHYISEIRSTTTAVVVGTLLTCLVQGALAGLGYFVAGVPAPVLCGLLTAVAALVPVVGTALVWAPLVILVAVNGFFFKAGLLAFWCLVFVGLADNVVRPLAIGAKSNIPTLAIVLGAVGGAFAMGLIGLILGPIFFALFVIVWRDFVDTGKAV
jgi:predicted PurR-regulated permease PerM